MKCKQLTIVIRVINSLSYLNPIKSHEVPIESPCLLVRHLCFGCPGHSVTSQPGDRCESIVQPLPDGQAVKSRITVLSKCLDQIPQHYF